MTKELVVSSTSNETRVALLENGHIAELYIERGHEKGIVRQYLPRQGYPGFAGHAGRICRHRPRKGSFPLCRGRSLGN